MCGLGSQFGGVGQEDASHWEEYGIYTVEQYNRYMLIAGISDAYKSAYGTRPRGMDFDSMSTTELEDYSDRLNELAHEVYLEEKAHEAEDVQEFKALIQRTIDLGAKDEETALRWITDGETFYSTQCVEHFVYNQGILFTDYGKDLCKRLEDIVTYSDLNEDAA